MGEDKKPDRTDPYDNDEFSRSYEEPRKENWHRDETPNARNKRMRKEAEKFFRKGEKWVKKYD